MSIGSGFPPSSFDERGDALLAQRLQSVFRQIDVTLSVFGVVFLNTCKGKKSYALRNLWIRESLRGRLL